MTNSHLMHSGVSPAVTCMSHRWHASDRNCFTVPESVVLSMWTTHDVPPVKRGNPSVKRFSTFSCVRMRTSE